MQDICPNCRTAVIYYSPRCSDHRTEQSTLALSPKTKSPVPRHTPKAFNAERPSLETLLQTVAHVFNVSTDELRRKRKGNQKPFCIARQLFSFVAHSTLRYKMREIGEFLDISTAGVSNKTAAIRDDIVTHKGIRSLHDQIVERITLREVA